MRKFLPVSVIAFAIFISLISPANAILLTANILSDPSVIDFSQFASNPQGPFEGPVQVGDLVGADVSFTGGFDGTAFGAGTDKRIMIAHQKIPIFRMG